MEQTQLRETDFCDFGHPAVSRLADELAKGETDARRIAEAVFGHVRDNIRFGFDAVQVKASETLAKGYGVCWNKALLTIALMRRNKIPARLAYNSVKRDFMRPAIGDACQALPETMNHCLVQVQLDDEWITIDGVLDAATYHKLFVPHGVAWGIDWNGKDDLLLYTENIAGPVGLFEDIDAAIRRDVDNTMPPPAAAEAFFGSANQQIWKAIDG